MNKKAKPHSPSLQRHFIGSVLSIHIIVLVVTVLICFYVTFTIYKKQFEQQFQNSLSYMSVEMDNFIENIFNITNSITLDDNIQSYLSDSFSYSAEDIKLQQTVMDRLSQLTSAYPYIDSITIFQDNSFIVSVSNDRQIRFSNNASLAVQQADAYQEILQSSSPVWGGKYTTGDFFPSYYSNHNDTNVISILMPLYIMQDSLSFSVLSINVSAEYMQSFLTQNLPLGCLCTLNTADNEQLLSSTTIPSDLDDRSYIFTQQLSTADWYLSIILPFSALLQKMQPLLLSLSVILILSSAVTLFISTLISNKLLNPFQNIIEQIDKISNGNLKYRIAPQKYQELNILCSHFNNMMNHIQELMQANEDYSEEKRNMEIQILQAQINPHFIQNTLTSIRWMASMARAQNVCQSLLALSNILISVFSTREIFWNFQSEIAFLQNYTDIMNYRTGGNIKLIFHIPEEFLDFPILRFLLQPIVENSILHGFIPNKNSTYHSCEIVISAEREQELLSLHVSDNGKGISPQQAEQLNTKLQTETFTPKNHDQWFSIGLSNVYKRIKLQYGEGSGLTIKPQHQGTCIQIYLRL